MGSGRTDYARNPMGNYGNTIYSLLRRQMICCKKYPETPKLFREENPCEEMSNVQHTIDLEAIWIREVPWMPELP